MQTRGEEAEEGEANGRPGFRRGHAGARAVIHWHNGPGNRPGRPRTGGRRRSLRDMPEPGRLRGGRVQEPGRRGGRESPTSFPSVNALRSVAVRHVALVWRNYVSVTRLDKSSESGPRYEFLPFYSTRPRVLEEREDVSYTWYQCGHAVFS